MVSAATCGWIAWLEHVFGEVPMGSDPSSIAIGSDPLGRVGSGPLWMGSGPLSAFGTAIGSGPILIWMGRGPVEVNIHVQDSNLVFIMVLYCITA